MKICIVIPCYNEAKRLPVAQFREYLNQHHDFTIYYCFVDDGSKDNTAHILYTLKNEFPNHVSIITLHKNTGKAEAVRHGVMAMHNTKKFDFIGYWDADLATPLAEIDHIANNFKRYPSFLGIFAIRLARLGACVKRKKMRHYIGRIFATAVSMILNQPIYDSQCGAKIFKQHIIPICFQEQFFSKWLFDVEILLRVQQHYAINKLSTLGSASLSAIFYEMPVMKWEDVKGSKIKCSFFIIAPIHLLHIFFKYKVLRK